MLSEEGWRRQEALDPEIAVGHSRELYWIWNSKSSLLLESTSLNPFNSSYFAWIDIGAIRHTRWNGIMMMNKFPLEPGILLLRVGEFESSELQLDGRSGENQADFTKVNRIGGGTIGGDTASIDRWNQVFYAVLHRYMRSGRFAGKDQSVMATACLESDICLLLDGSPFLSFTQPRWFLLQDYFQGRLYNQEPVRLNITKPSQTKPS